VEQKDSCANFVVIELQIVPHGTQGILILMRKALRQTLFHVEQSELVCALLTLQAMMHRLFDFGRRSFHVEQNNLAVHRGQKKGQMFHVEPTTD